MAQVPVSPNEIAAVVTYLEMPRRPRPAPLMASPLRLERWKTPAPARYRILFRRVGEPWLWFSRLAMNDAELTRILDDPLVEIYAVLDPKGIEVGLLELDFRKEGICNIAFFGLVVQLTGQGLGGWLTGQAISLGWRAGVGKLTVNTCSLDDPRALSSYRKNGFMPVRRAIETFEDPRIAGLLPLEAAPHIPLIRQGVP